jgi:hypothetical protein
MKKGPYVLLAALGMIFALTACSKADQATTTQTTPGSPQLDVSKMSADEKLAIGTLKLEGTDLAVDKEEAGKLLPLWKAVRALKMDDTISTQEMDALYQQIKDAMTAEQVKAIDAMTFESEDINQLMASLGVGFGTAVEQAGNAAQGSTEPGDMGPMPEFSTGGGTSTNRRSGSNSNFPSGGGAPPAGGMPEGGVMMFEGRPGENANQTSQNAGQAATGRMNNMFIEPLIRLLKDRISS